MLAGDHTCPGASGPAIGHGSLAMGHASSACRASLTSNAKVASWPRMTLPMVRRSSADHRQYGDLPALPAPLSLNITLC